MNIHFYNGKVLRDGQFISEDLWVSDGKISPPLVRLDKKINLEGKLICPGYIDLQVNGAAGIDLSTAPEKVNEVSLCLAKYGVTAFLATVVSSTPENYRRIIPILQKHIGKTLGAELLGIHLEGPCFNTKQAKAHDKTIVRSCAEFGSPEECYGNMDGVKLVTLAPEVPGANEWIKWLVDGSITVAAGHTQASTQQMRTAIDAGLGMATHLFNAMAPFHHRAPGIIGEVMLRPGFPYSIIADGIHVDPMAIALMHRCQPEGLILVSDAMSALGLSEGTYWLGRMQVNVEGGKALLQNTETLAGSISALDQNVRNFKEYARVDNATAVLAATAKPAKVIGVHPKKGSLEIGADADLIILDKNLNIISQRDLLSH